MKGTTQQHNNNSNKNSYAIDIKNVQNRNELMNIFTNKQFCQLLQDKTINVKLNISINADITNPNSGDGLQLGQNNVNVAAASSSSSMSPLSPPLSPQLPTKTKKIGDYVVNSFIIYTSFLSKANIKVKKNMNVWNLMRDDPKYGNQFHDLMLWLECFVKGKYLKSAVNHNQQQPKQWYVLDETPRERLPSDDEERLVRKMIVQSALGVVVAAYNNNTNNTNNHFGDIEHILNNPDNNDIRALYAKLDDAQRERIKQVFTYELERLTRTGFDYNLCVERTTALKMFLNKNDLYLTTVPSTNEEWVVTKTLSNQQEVPSISLKRKYNSISKSNNNNNNNINNDDNDDEEEDKMVIDYSHLPSPNVITKEMVNDDDSDYMYNNK